MGALDGSWGRPPTMGRGCLTLHSSATHSHAAQTSISKDPWPDDHLLCFPWATAQVCSRAHHPLPLHLCPGVLSLQSLCLTGTHMHTPCAQLQTGE